MKNYAVFTLGENPQDDQSKAASEQSGAPQAPDAGTQAPATPGSDTPPSRPPPQEKAPSFARHPQARMKDRGNPGARAHLQPQAGMTVGATAVGSHPRSLAQPRRQPTAVALPTAP